MSEYIGVLAEIAAERRRQITVEGWDAAHDDEHEDESLALVAACYAITTEWREFGHRPGHFRADDPPIFWPRSWADQWWKPKDRRRDLVRAGALIVAEIDRLDRAAANVENVE